MFVIYCYKTLIMTTKDFIDQAIGNLVYVTGDRVVWFLTELKLKIKIL